jgi:hypothetical protein
MNVKANKPKVSIVYTTYNHEAFIAKALNGFIRKRILLLKRLLQKILLLITLVKLLKSMQINIQKS